MSSKEYLFSFFIMTVLLVIFYNNQIFAQNEFTNDSSSTDNSLVNTMSNSDQGNNVQYYDYNTNDSAFDETMNSVDNLFSGSLDNYQQPSIGEHDTLANFGESLSNSIFNDTSIFGVLGYSLIDNVKIIGAQTNDNNSIKVTLGYNNKNTSSPSPSVTLVAHKLDINLNDMANFLSSVIAGSNDMMMMMSSSQSLPFDNNMPVFDVINNFKIGSNMADSGWSSPHDVTIKVRNGGLTHQNESDISIILIELIPQG